MSTYRITGIVHPERAVIENHKFDARASRPGEDIDLTFKGQILMNQLLVIVESHDKWDVWDLRNTILFFVESELSLVGFLLGHAYRPEIIRMTNEERDIDIVFGIDVPCLSRKYEDGAFAARLQEIKDLCNGLLGIYLIRCFHDLMSAIRYPTDTPFFCYRGIEALKNHHVMHHGLEQCKSSDQWESFRNQAGIQRAEIEKIKLDADHLRHNREFFSAVADRASLFEVTWEITEKYLKSIQETDALRLSTDQ